MKTQLTEPKGHTQFEPNDFTLGDRSRGCRCLWIRCEDGVELPAQILTLQAHSAALPQVVESLRALCDALETPDANRICEEARQSLLYHCPEYKGFLKQARFALQTAQQSLPSETQK